MSTHPPTRVRTRLEQELDIEFRRRLSIPLEEWVMAGRFDGRSWRVLAKQIKRLTGTPVTHQTLYLWYGRKAAA